VPDLKPAWQKPSPHTTAARFTLPGHGLSSAAYDAKYSRPQGPDPGCTFPPWSIRQWFIQYAPYKLKEGTWDTEKDKFADRCFDLLNEYAPNFKQSVIARQIVTPLDLERTFALTGGNIFQGSMLLHQLFMFRPAPGYADYHTPIKNLYICGSAGAPAAADGSGGWEANLPCWDIVSPTRLQAPYFPNRPAWAIASDMRYLAWNCPRPPRRQ
jgi:hypothetical protein